MGGQRQVPAPSVIQRTAPEQQQIPGVYSNKDTSGSSNKSEQVRHEDDVDQVCSECGLRAMRIKQSEGILVCMECGVVERDRMINFGQNEVRNFDSETSNANMQRVGGAMRLDEINRMGTELSWAPNQKQK